MQHAHNARIQVGHAALRVQQLTEASRVQRCRHRIDAEVAPREVGGHVRAAAYDDRQRSRVGVDLGAGCGEVERPAVQPQLDRAERRSRAARPAEPLRESWPEFGGGRFRCEVEVEHRASEQGVAHRSADEPQLDALVRGCIAEAAQQGEVVRDQRGVERYEGHGRRVSPRRSCGGRNLAARCGGWGRLPSPSGSVGAATAARCARRRYPPRARPRCPALRGCAPR